LADDELTDDAGNKFNLATAEFEDIQNSNSMRQLRQEFVDGGQPKTCRKCWREERAGRTSKRIHTLDRLKHMLPDQEWTADAKPLMFLDLKLGNICNLKCRSCGHIFSSQWYQDQAKLAGGNWKESNQVLNYAGRTETDMWEQLLPHMDYVEQIYFAGGEPLLMEEHYRILDELVRRERFDVRLIYNTNFTHTDLKGQSVFEYWKLFKNVAVGASLDGSGKHAEYIRKGTDWKKVEQNRIEMLQVCPQVDFYISPTLSIMNAWQLPDFHRAWVERGFIKPQDLNVNILQDPAHLRIDIAPVKYKQLLRVKYQEHINCLQDKDPLQRATVGFESAVKFMMATDNTHLIDTFWRKTHELDSIRSERLLDVIPELQALL
jgi:organic radical activating enzyme